MSQLRWILIAVWADIAFAAAPPPLFSQILDASANPPPRVQAKYPVTINFDPLDANANVIRVVLPGSKDVEYLATRTRREALQSGGYQWFGKTSEHDVILTVDGERVTGFVRGGGDTYAIMSGNGPAGMEYSLSRVDSETFPSDIVEGWDAPLGAAAIMGSVAKANSPDFPQAQCFGAADETIDVLLVYSPESYAAAGGDLALLRNQVANAEAKANTTLVNSNVPARIKIVAVEAAPQSLTQTGTTFDLDSARENVALADLRRMHRADVVAFLVTEIGNEGSQYCGVTRAQRRAGDYYFGTGYDFYESAVLVLAHECMVLENDLSHEIGHIVGLDHNPANTAATQLTGIFPFAFGHSVNFFFRDDMSGTRACPNGCPRQMFFSDPTMLSHGYPRGTQWRNNAETYRRMYRCTNTLADFIFVDNFE